MTAYTVVITEDPEEPGIYNAVVPAIPGCFSYGHSKKEALNNVTEALCGCLEIIMEDGDPIPEDVAAETRTVRI